MLNTVNLLKSLGRSYTLVRNLLLTTDLLNRHVVKVASKYVLVSID